MPLKMPCLRLMLALAGAALAVWPWAAAQANAQSAEYAAGGLVFKQSASIAMTSEDLYLSMRQVRVVYVFRSFAPAAQKLLLVFPMPPMPTGYDPDGLVRAPEESLALMHSADIHPYNYMNFTVRVNGKPVTTHASGRALLGNRDVTRLLSDAGVQLMFRPDDYQALLELPEPVRRKLSVEGLLDSDYPKWNYQTIYEWDQTFPPGETRVEISYQPAVGDRVDVNGLMTPDSGDAKKYCIDASLRRALHNRQPFPEMYTLGYILSTAKGWKGPIGRFHLVVEKASQRDLLAFCPAGAKKISPTRFEWNAVDFVPERDLNIMFFVEAS